jgi:hypothetical protein
MGNGRKKQTLKMKRKRNQAKKKARVQRAVDNKKS